MGSSSKSERSLDFGCFFSHKSFSVTLHVNNRKNISKVVSSIQFPPIMFFWLLKFQLYQFITLLKAETASFSITVKSDASSQKNGNVLEHASSIAPAKVHSTNK